MIYMPSPIFDHVHPIIITVTFNFPKFVSACKKIRPFYRFILEIQQILEPQDLKDLAHFWLTPFTKIIIKVAFLNFYQYTKNQFIPLTPLITKFSNKSKKRYFWPIFRFLGYNFFLKFRLLHTQHKKTTEPIPLKLPDRKMEGQKYGRADPNI